MSEYVAMLISGKTSRFHSNNCCRLAVAACGDEVTDAKIDGGRIASPNSMLRGMNTKMRISPSLSPCSKTPCMTAMLDRLCQRPFRLHQLGQLEP